MANEKTLTPAQAAINAALVAQYDKPAKVIARKADAIEKAKGDTWAAFKDGAAIGLEAGQDVATMAKGIALACAHYDVPQGTVNAYLPLLRKLYAAIVEGGEDRETVLAMSVKDARQRWQPKKAKDNKAKPEASKVEGAANAAESSDGSVGDADGVMGGSNRSRILSRINAALATLSDADLSAVLDMLEDEYVQAKAA